ncbi:MAG TPA: hypothetical protein VN812_22355 [Candidatus Acidoferrales bacterium]|jgi:hypothetical protein|nr:hypothetical protein [Candidatus Acidoferrales bacterium]
MAGAAYASDVFEPDVMLPAQFFSTPSRAVHQPEKRLMLAVLEEAVLTFCKHLGDTRVRSRRLVREVEQWMDSRHTNWPFSFENICATLSLDPGALRQGLQRMQPTEARAARAHVLSFAIGRRVAGERHRVSAPRSHRRTNPEVD